MSKDKKGSRDERIKGTNKCVNEIFNNRPGQVMWEGVKSKQKRTM